MGLGWARENLQRPANDGPRFYLWSVRDGLNGIEQLRCPAGPGYHRILIGRMDRIAALVIMIFESANTIPLLGILMAGCLNVC